MTIGVLALQGGFAEHRLKLLALGGKVVLIRTPDDLTDNVPAGLVLPGGESTSISKLLQSSGLFEPIRQLIVGGVPVLGTCAGLILLAGQVDDARIHGFQVIDIRVARNIYGRQLGSFLVNADFAGLGRIPMTFIRAPGIIRTGPAVEILAIVNGRPVAARQGNILVTAFHPELTDSLAVHRLFLESCARHARTISNQPDDWQSNKV